MQASENRTCVAFHGHEQIASGALAQVALAVKQALDAGAAGPLLIFDDQSSRQIEPRLAVRPATPRSVWKYHWYQRRCSAAAGCGSLARAMFWML